MKTENFPASSSKKKLIRVAKIAFAFYALAGIAVYHLQEKFMFHPTPLEANAAFSFPDLHKEVNIQVDASTNYNLVQFTTPDTPKGVVLYFHGNMENVNHYAAAAKNFTSNGYEIWMIDYPGFGKSSGELTEETMYQQALEVYKMSRKQFEPSEIIIYGRSIGSGVAAQLASIRDCKRLVLETPYYSLTTLASRFLWMYPMEAMSKFKLPTFQYLSKVTAPVTIFHGTEDGVIPYRHAEKLKEVLKKNDAFITIKGGSHNDLISFPIFQQNLRALLQPAEIKLTTTSL